MRSPLKRPVVLHPLLIAVYPVLFLYQQNKGEVSAGAVVWPSLAAAGLALTTLLLVRAVVHDRMRAAVIASAFLILFFMYGHVWGQVKGRQLGNVIIDRDVYFLPFWALIMFGTLAFAAQKRSSLPEITKIANSVGVVLVAMASLGSALHRGDATASSLIGRIAPDAQAMTGSVGAPKRDIYYIIMDRYAGPVSLRKAFNFDNSPFLGSLRARGFVVADESLANYPKTDHSLAASLNMNYLDPMSELGPTSDVKPMRQLVQDNAVRRFVHEHGYRYIQVGANNSITAFNPYADRNVRYDRNSGFTLGLYTTTMLEPVGRRFGVDPRLHEWGRTRFQFDQLEGSTAWAGPKFVFAHILLPHDPYLFRRDGSYRSEGDALSSARNGMYLEQIEYANQRLSHLLDKLLVRPEEARPIVLLQADEGPHPYRIDLHPKPLEWWRSTDAELVEKFPILNAYYFPGIEHPDIPPTISPVNSFRKIFNLYFGTNLPMLPDRSYIFKNATHLYTFTDVTARVRHGSG